MGLKGNEEVANQSGRIIKILFLAAEASPLVKVGGLGDVAGALPVALRKLDDLHLDVRLVLPYHRDIRQRIPEPKQIASFEVPHPAAAIPARVFQTDLEGLPIYLIDGPPIPPDGPVYNGTDPTVDGNKYIFFSLACLEMLKNLNWQPDILHANDWHTAAAIYAYKFGKVKYSQSRLGTVLTIHNLPFMGKDAEKAVQEFGLPAAKDNQLPGWATSFPLPMGMTAADKIVAVSPGYAGEILTPEFGCGLQDFLTTRKNDLLGIFNGLEKNLWNPNTDRALPVRFNIDQISDRLENKNTLQNELGLPINSDIPLLIIISRMDQQKGVDIAVNGLRLSSSLGWQAVILGTGDPLLETACRSLEAEYPNRIRTLIKFDSKLSRRMYGGGDILLMPSRYEPCGLAQMIAMNYGCIPLARSTGGLKDTILDDPTLAKSTGFLFDEPTPEAFSETLQRALFTFQDRLAWEQIQKRGMQTDFGWEKPAAQYADLYQQLLRGDL
jgi:starch synthase